ncbi:uncharacterized protein LOC128186272 [Crassostrea angulata]|uniref:uncharacterized protein LOC128186272 n=1 Tax=Magallana angulata TaxID=2784310 RepID=UPI0022B0BACE|nr:uncharacterized protein LOC128186272 [Crassostrea angulata]
MTHMLWDFGNGDKWQNGSSSDAISFLIMINEKVHESVARFTTLKSCKKALSNIISNGSCLTFNCRHYFTSTQRFYKTLKLSVLFSDDFEMFDESCLWDMFQRGFRMKHIGRSIFLCIQ